MGINITAVCPRRSYKVLKGLILSYQEGLKPIFHCDAKLLASGNFVLPNTKDSTFALPNAKNTNMLVSLALGDANFLRWPCTFYFFGIDFIRVG